MLFFFSAVGSLSRDESGEYFAEVGSVELNASVVELSAPLSSCNDEPGALRGGAGDCAVRARTFSCIYTARYVALNIFIVDRGMTDREDLRVARRWGF